MAVLMLGAALVSFRIANAQTVPEIVGGPPVIKVPLPSPDDPGEVPLMLKFKGVLLGPNGRPVTKQTEVTFGIFQQQEGGDALWMETQDMQPDSRGNYTAMIGAFSKGVPLSIFQATTARWLGVVSNEFQAQPRILLVSVPYALESANAQTLAGHSISEFVLRGEARSLPNEQIVRSALRLRYPRPDWTSMAPMFESTNRRGPSFVSDAASGPPLRVVSRDLVKNLNVELLNGLSDSAFAKLGLANVFTEQQIFGGGLTAPPLSISSVENPLGNPSTGLDLQASVFNNGTNVPETANFRWQSEPAGSNTPNPSATLNLLFGLNKTPSETGLSVNADGTINFAPGQHFPLAAIETALGNAGLSTTGSSSQSDSSSPIVTTSPSYSWQQQVAGTTGLTAGVNTITLKPCPRGVNGTDLWHYLYISGTGTPEAVLITGGSCTSGNTSGTIAFIAAYDHPAGYTIGSATDGVQETINDAVIPGTDGQVSRNVLISPRNYVFHARLSIRASGISIGASGGTITCMVQDTCIMLGDPQKSTAFNRITLHDIQVHPGIVKGTWPAIEDDAQKSTITNLSEVPGGPTQNSFGYLIQIDNDQAATVEGLDADSGPWARCDLDFCSTAVYGPGPFSTNAGVIWIKNSNISTECQANGVDNLDGNTLHIQDSVVQAFPQFGVRSKETWGVVTGLELDNVYMEVGGCTNPQFNHLQAEAGLIVNGGQAKVSGQNPVGNVPQFANTGNTIYGYWIVVHSSTKGTSPAYFAGYAKTNGSGQIPVVWYQVGTIGTITYDVLRKTIVGGGGGSDTPPFGTGTFAVATNIDSSSCSNHLCSITDDAAGILTPYTVAAYATYFPNLSFWPGAVILTAGDGSLIEPVLVTDETAEYALPQGGYVSSGGNIRPSVVATQEQCCSGGSMSNVWITALGQDSVFDNLPSVGATLMQQSVISGNTANRKGRLNFIAPVDNGAVAHSEVVTIGDCDPAKTLATPGNRPTYDGCDSYIGVDNPNDLPYHFQMSFGAPISISSYIGQGPDGSSWLERLTNAGKFFKVPVTIPSLSTATNCASATGTCGTASAGRITMPAGSAITTVMTSAVTPNSEIHLDENLSYGSALEVTCNATLGRHYAVLSQTYGSFVIMTDQVPVGAPACLSYSIVN